MPTSRSTSVRSPFFVIDELLSPLSCEQIVDEIDFNGFSVDPATSKPTKTTLTNKRCDVLVEDALVQHIDAINRHFGVEVDDVLSIAYEWFPEGCASLPAAADGFTRMGRDWVRSSSEDLVAILFMSQYNTVAPFDSDFEVFGGKLEYPTFGFGFNPTMGSLIVHPAAPNFISTTSPVIVGDLFQARIRLSSRRPVRFDIRDYPGDFRTWFR